MYIGPDSVFGKIVIFFFNAVSLVYKSLSYLYLSIKSMRKKKFPECYIISVDNLAFGGTGKTPMVVMLAEELLKLQIPVAVVTRGYRSGYVRSGLRVGLTHNAREAGDEALLLKSRLPEAEVFIGKDRKRSIEAAIRIGSKFIVLDDGFQSTDIAKDFSIMLLNPRHPYYYLRNFRFLSNNEKVKLTYREPESAVSGVGNYWFSMTGSYDRSGRGVEIGASAIVGFSALGDNDRFFRDLQTFDCVGFRAFPDHHAFDIMDIQELDEFRRTLHADYLVCTEKDFIKIQFIPFGEIPLIFVKNSIKLDIDLCGQILNDAKTKGFF